MWETSFLRGVVDPYFFSEIHAWEHGSEHQKSTGFLSNFFMQDCKPNALGHIRTSLGQLDGLNLVDTAKAAEYTLQLSQAIARSFMGQFKDDPRFSLEDSSNNYVPKVVTQLQPRETRSLCWFRSSSIKFLY